MPIITITSDWGKTDFYSGILKGILKTDSPNVDIIDINNEIDSFNIAQAAFIIANSYKYFPQNTIHIIAIKSEAKTDHKHIVIKDNGHYFICADNGIPGLIFKDTPELIVELETINIQESFPEATVFTKICKYIVDKGDITELGISKNSLFRQIDLLPSIGTDYIAGTVIYNDSYGNAITNISKDIFNQYHKNRTYEITFVSTRYIISKLSTNYFNVPEGEKLALFNSINLLEIAINNGNAKNLLGLEKGINIKIKFK
jgi:S-adenosylmethionine hydrolase